ncbi:SAM-dependent methyltransferase [Kitasatospora purpeofusca]|uniref:N-6 DNA methylase n=1 Tax=Kitasatospora purpeofusca TaxID=67352 RepID=UPI002E124A17|nr:N-6 DNA methylase [Kitasatospora purpeofusca]WSR40124.1 SAM-dependent methyltransferase [Kitasatospora purpeofusca]
MPQQLNIFAQQPDDEDDDMFFPPPAQAARPRLAAVPDLATRTLPTSPPPKPATKPKPTARRYPVPRSSPHKAAQRIVEVAVDTWHRNHGGGRMDIPVGLVAALSLWPLKGPDAPLQAGYILGLDARDLVQLLRECWAYWWMRRPDLVHRAAPIARWTEEDLSDHHLASVKAVAHAVITNGLLTLTGSSDPGDLAECDLMSWMITGLRSRGDRNWLGEFHTPPEVCDMIARMQLGDGSDVGPDFSVLDPTAGTGGMVRSLAQAMRDRQIDPAAYRWHLVDLDPISAAGAAVNMMLWGMGPHTTVWCGNSLAPVDTAVLAQEEKAELFELRERMQMGAATAYAIGKAERLIAGVVAEKAA